MIATSLSHVVQALGQTSPPRRITQQPFDYDSGHYQRLCHLNGSAPNCSDLACYIEDIKYMPLQSDLLRYLLPLCLKMWQDDLFDVNSDCAGTVEAFWTALSPRPMFQNTFVLEEELNAKEYQRVMQFMQDSLLERMSQETQLHFVGSKSSSYQWLEALGSFCTVFPALSGLWEDWWQMNTVGHAVCVLQYISCLMYGDSENPVFAPWTSDKGGGPPQLWGNANLVSCFGWRNKNASFLAKTITLDYVASSMRKATEIIGVVPGTPVPARMIADWPDCQSLAASRIAELPLLVSQSEPMYPGWSV